MLSFIVVNESKKILKRPLTATAFRKKSSTMAQLRIHSDVELCSAIYHSTEMARQNYLDKSQINSTVINDNYQEVTKTKIINHMATGKSKLKKKSKY